VNVTVRESLTAAFAELSLDISQNLYLFSF
jgi:hypothetical protein